jgi:uncharacterized membrane protein
MRIVYNQLMLKKILWSFFTALILVIFFVGSTNQTFASTNSDQPYSQNFYKAVVTRIIQEGDKDVGGRKSIYQGLELKIEEGTKKGLVVKVENGGDLLITPEQKVEVGDEVILTSFVIPPDNQTIYSIVDRYRLNMLPFIIFAFISLIIIVAGKKGIGAILGLAVSLLIIIKFLVPQMLAGADPVSITIITSLVILLATTYLAHGFSKQTTIALFSTFVSLVFTAVLSVLAVHLTHLAGFGNDEVYSLKINQTTAMINLQGLLLSGIIIGTLGALNDVTTTQVAAIFEFAKTADRRLGFSRLYEMGLVVGKEHIASLVNTLVLAYAGGSLAIFIIFVLNPSSQPYWVIMNSEIIFDEIVRTVVGSAGLILAVPIVTFMAAWYASRKK